MADILPGVLEGTAAAGVRGERMIMMERLTRPTVEVDETAAKYMGKGLNMETMNDRLLELILNGPTLMAVPKDHLRHIIRQLYGRLKEYEDARMTPCEYCDGAQKTLPVYVYDDIPYGSFNRIRIESDGAFLEDADGNDIRIKACPMCGRSLEERVGDSDA